MRIKAVDRRLFRRRLIVATAVPFLLCLALAAAKPGRAADDSLAKRIAGTWQFVSHKRITNGEEPVQSGSYVVFGTDGYANYFYVASNGHTATNDAEREAVLRFMLAWSGKYSAQDGKLTIENSNGTKIRQIKIDGDRLTSQLIKEPHPAAAAEGAGSDAGETVLVRVK